MKQAVEFLYGIPKFTKKHSLAHTKHFMELLGNPGNHCKVIHVAGSNGKGSVCCFLYHMLLSEGKTVGLFTSPHLMDVRERFQLNGDLCSEEQFLSAYARVKKTAEELDQKLAQRVRNIRKRRSISQEKLSSMSGVSYGSIKRFETTGQISLISLTKIAMALDIADELRNIFTHVPYKDIQEVINEGR